MLIQYACFTIFSICEAKVKKDALIIYFELGRSCKMFQIKNVYYIGIMGER
jgi:hypothetical protein